MSEAFKMAGVVVLAAFYTVAVVGWFAVLPTIGALWSIGLLK